jgi:topoisomerase-4 subunit B
VREFDIAATKERNGTFVSFIPDEKLFPKFHFIPEYIEKMLWNYCYLNEGLTINYNGVRLISKNGLVDLLNNEIDGSPLYPIVHIKDKDFEFAFTHINTQYGEEYFSFVNGQHTTQGGTHQVAFREAFARTVKEFYRKDYDTQDIRTSLVAAISIKVVEPVFESQTKTKLGSSHMEKGGEMVRNYILNSVKKNLDDYLHIHSDIAEAMLAKIHLSERERKEVADFKKITRERSKKTSLRNEKLRDCRLHYNESYKNEKDEERRLSTTIFITEGNSATGSITKIRDVNTQAVFSLRGKPLNSYGLGKKVVYENEEFNLLQAALNIGEELEGLRYNNIVVATDADVDGMHIRLLLLTFFLQFFPDIVRHGHVYVLQTPLFRVRNRQKTIYCYSEDEKTAALREFGTAAGKGSVEITRFKGLGEISPDEFKVFIGTGMRLDPVIMKKDQNVRELLTFYMGKNTPDRQGFIINNLRIDVD